MNKLKRTKYNKENDHFHHLVNHKLVPQHKNEGKQVF